MGGSVDVSVGPDTTDVSGDVLSEFGPQLVSLLGDVLQKPLLPASELPRLKADMQRQLSIARTQPGSIANDKNKETSSVTRSARRAVSRPWTSCTPIYPSQNNTMHGTMPRTTSRSLKPPAGIAAR